MLNVDQFMYPTALVPTALHTENVLSYDRVSETARVATWLHSPYHVFSSLPDKYRDNATDTTTASFSVFSNLFHGLSYNLIHI